MKKITITLVAATVIILFFFTGCDKYHRDRYTGTWEFFTIKGICINTTEEVGRDTIYYSGTISCGYSENDLMVHYTESDDISVRIDEAGCVYSFYGIGSSKGAPCGKFEKKDKVNFGLYWGDGQGGIEFHYINGIKKKGEKNE